jgi:uncharacterized protein (DUF1501 family)
MNMVVPTEEGMYRDLRQTLAISASDALPIAHGIGLHPNLPKLRDRFAAGQVAVLRGVGDLTPDMSHFTALARWMSGTGASSAATGWLGRWLDGYGRADDLSAIAVGSQIPLALVGAKRKAIALPPSGGDAITGDHHEAWVRRSLDTLRDFGAGPTGAGAWADAIGSGTRTAIDLADVVKPVYAEKLPNGKLTAQLTLAARLINANLGTRVLQVQYGDFDTHAGQAATHAGRMAELDAAVAAFFATLSPSFAKRTTILTLSEFGRRADVNGSGGTDHGEASDLLAIGGGVRGGVYGEATDLHHLSEHGCAMAMVDFRSVYATVLETCLGADPRQVLGGTFEKLGFLKRPTT